MVALQRRPQDVRENGFRALGPVLEKRSQLGLDDLEHLRVGPRRREHQVHELEEGLGVARGGVPRQPLLELADRRADEDRLPGQLLLEGDGAEPAQSPGGHDLVGGVGRHQVLVFGERDAARADGPHQDLVFLEIRRLEDDPGAVGQRPLDGPGRLDRPLGDDLARLGQLGQERLVGRRVLVRRDLQPVDFLEDGQELGFLGDRDTRLLGNVDQHDPVLHAHPRLGQAVDLLESDAGQEADVHLVLVCDPGRRLALEEGPGELLGVGRGILGLLLGQGALEGAHHLAFIALELGRGEAVPGHPLPFRVKGPQPSRDAALLGEGREDESLLRADERPVARDRSQERRPGLLGHLGETLVEHADEQPLDEHLPVGADRALVPQRQLVVDRHDAVGGLLVGDDREQRLAVVGDGVVRARRSAGAHEDGPEVLLDELLDAAPVEVADGDDGHQVRAVPGPVVALQGLVGEGLDDLFLADGQALGVARAPQQDRELRVAHPGVGPPVEAPFLDDDAALLLDGRRVEAQPVGPILEDEERRLQDGRGVRGHLEHVDRLVEAGEGVEVGPEAHADGLHEIDELLAREVPGAVEGQVLDHVGQAPLVVVLEHGAGPDDEPELGPVAGLAVLADPVTEAVGELADRDLGVDGDLPVKGRVFGGDGLGRGGRDHRVLAPGPDRQGDGEKGRQQDRRAEGRKGERTDSSGLSHPLHHSRFRGLWITRQADL